MNVRGAAVQSGLAALGLVVAYTTWQREPERAPGEVIVVDVNKSDVQSVRIDEGDGKTVEMERRKDASGEEPRVWLKLSADAKQKKPAREVPGNEGADRLWDKFGPLRATRALGTLKRRQAQGARARRAEEAHRSDRARRQAHVRRRQLAVRRLRSVRQGRAGRPRLRVRRRAHQRSRVGGRRGSSIASCTRSSRATTTAVTDLGGRQVAHAAGAAVGECVRGEAGRTPRPASPTTWPRTGTTRSGA